MTSNLSKVSYAGTTTFDECTIHWGNKTREELRSCHSRFNRVSSISKRSKVAKIVNIVIYSLFSDN